MKIQSTVLFATLVALICFAGVACAQVPWDGSEVNACIETQAVFCPWGDADSEFAPPRAWGDRITERGPGPFFVGEDGYIYIYDWQRANVKVFGPDGNWTRTLVIGHPESRDRKLDDMAVLGTHRNPTVITLRERTRGHLVNSGQPIGGFFCYAYTYDQGYDTASVMVVEIDDNSDLNTCVDARGRTRVIAENVRLHVENDDVYLLNRRTSLAQPIILGNEKVSISSQKDQIKIGVAIKDMALIRDKLGRVELNNGSAFVLIVRDVTGIVGTNNNGEFVARLNRVNPDGGLNGYCNVYNTNGEILSATQIPRREWAAMVEIKGGRFQASDEGWYEMWIESDGVHISHWQ